MAATGEAAPSPPEPYVFWLHGCDYGRPGYRYYEWQATITPELLSVPAADPPVSVWPEAVVAIDSYFGGRGSPLSVVLTVGNDRFSSQLYLTPANALHPDWAHDNGAEAEALLKVLSAFREQAPLPAEISRNPFERGYAAKRQPPPDTVPDAQTSPWQYQRMHPPPSQQSVQVTLIAVLAIAGLMILVGLLFGPH